MFKVYGFIPKRADLDAAAFKKYYESKHVPLVLSKTPAPLVYKRNYVLRGDDMNLDDESISFDVVTELVFENRDGFRSWLSDLNSDEIASDEAEFMDRSGIRISVIDERASPA